MPLVVSIKPNEVLRIGSDILVALHEAEPHAVRLVINAPEEQRIERIGYVKMSGRTRGHGKRRRA